MSDIIDNIRWLGHGSFMIQGPPIIYINPWRVVRSAFLADVILIGHDHYDHCSVADVQKLRGDETRIVGNEKVAQQIPDTQVIRPFHSVTIDRASIKAVPAYSPNDIRHARDDGGLGFVISLNYYDIYYTGDTGIIPEMAMIQPDVLMLPIDNAGTLSLEEAVQVVEQLRPRYTFPCNWGARGEGVTIMEAKLFKKMVGGRSQVIVPDINEA